MKKLSIVIPASSEAHTLRKLAEEILAVPFPLDDEIILADDHNGDQTFKIATLTDRQVASGRLQVFRNDVNRGKGYCIFRGLEHAEGDVVAVQDADFE